MSKDLIENVQNYLNRINLYNKSNCTAISQPQSAWGSSTPTLRGFTTYATVFWWNKGEKWQYAYDSNPEEEWTDRNNYWIIWLFIWRSNVGGVINYIPKDQLSLLKRSITVGNTGRRWILYLCWFKWTYRWKGKFGYRLNVLSQDGNTFVE